MVKKQRTRKYFAPQSEDKTQACDHPGCNKKGEYRAPKDRSLKDYYWFCLEHVQEYNSKWNYYEGISSEAPEDEEPGSRNHFKFKSKVKYQFGHNMRDDFGFFDEYTSDYRNLDEAYFSNEEKKHLRTMELDSKNLDIKLLKKQYKKLAKKYHPDTNQGDKEKEEKFKEVTMAYHALLCKVS